jgi:galactokinase
MNEARCFPLEAEKRQGSWLDYVQGVVVALRERGFSIGGFDAVVTSNVPLGSGLSSSAALEVSLLRAIREAFGLPMSDLELARIGRAAENDFVGVPVGIMDQMAASLADTDSALFIDTRSLAFERVPLPRSVDLVVLDSGVEHDHRAGGYAQRRAECHQAAQLLGIPSLRDTDDRIRAASLPQPLSRRVRHVATENARVLEAVACMRNGNCLRLGEILNESHRSLRDDFEVSVPAVDQLVAITQSDPEAFGARMTGGGFGGSIVALARSGCGPRVAARVLNIYGGQGKSLIPEVSHV